LITCLFVSLFPQIQVFAVVTGAVPARPLFASGSVGAAVPSSSPRGVAASPISPAMPPSPSPSPDAADETAAEAGGGSAAATPKVSPRWRKLVKTEFERVREKRRTKHADDLKAAWRDNRSYVDDIHDSKSSLKVKAEGESVERATKMKWACLEVGQSTSQFTRSAKVRGGPKGGTLSTNIRVSRFFRWSGNTNNAFLQFKGLSSERGISNNCYKQGKPSL
jgi:hypothetical protein